MPHISSTFSDPHAGRLEITLRGRWDQTGASSPGIRDDGSTTYTPPNLVLRAFVGPTGALSYTESIDRYQRSVNMQLNYPGGNVVWQVGTEEVTRRNPTGGPTLWLYGFRDLTIDLVLIRR